ncbi:MAG: pirin family protein [Bacteroidota bacterium]
MRSVKQIKKAFKVNMGGIVLDQALPFNGTEQIDPFLLIHHWSDRFKGGQKQKNVGVPPHPHRGFAPVTLVFKGAVHHRDSIGNSDVIEEGGTQWMNSGNGIVHSERPKKEIAEEGGDFEIIQFWVNAPASKKTNPADYQPLRAEDMQIIKSEDGKCAIGLVAGELNDKRAEIDTYSQMTVLRLDMEKDGILNIPLDSQFNALIYVLDGEVQLQGQIARDRDLIWFNNDGKSIELSATEQTRAILLSGKPIGEPLVTYGPFVMNTEREIAQAIHDYQQGKMGTLTEEFE